VPLWSSARHHKQRWFPSRFLPVSYNPNLHRTEYLLFTALVALFSLFIFAPSFPSRRTMNEISFGVIGEKVLPIRIIFINETERIWTYRGLFPFEFVYLIDMLFLFLISFFTIIVYLKYNRTIYRSDVRAQQYSCVLIMIGVKSTSVFSWQVILFNYIFVAEIRFGYQARDLSQLISHELSNTFFLRTFPRLLNLFAR
jgi:hypothetical protein